MRFSDMVNRLTGFSTPVFGVSWSPRAGERDEATLLIAFLEDRRVLFAPSQLEIPYHCVESILEIRKHLTAVIGKLDAASNLTLHCRAMRGECRKFLDKIGPETLEHANSWGHYQSWVFSDALGQLRGVFGSHLAAICAAYGVDVESQLAEIFPAVAE